jgi:hypothetical protein
MKRLLVTAAIVIITWCGVIGLGTLAWRAIASLTGS